MTTKFWRVPFKIEGEVEVAAATDAEAWDAADAVLKAFPELIQMSNVLDMKTAASKARVAEMASATVLYLKRSEQAAEARAEEQRRRERLDREAEDAVAKLLAQYKTAHEGRNIAADITNRAMLRIFGCVNS